MKPSPKVRSPQQLARILKKRKKGAKVVFTNGCFDILHLGHVTYLEQAKKLGHLLVVALDTDESVQKLKGPARPVNSLADRMGVIAGLEAVDYVTWFEGSDPRPLIRLLHPQVLVKGGDWKPSQILGSEDVLSWRGKVRSLPFLDGRSTTAIIAKAQIK